MTTTLSPRQRQVLDLASRGLSYVEVGQRLGLSFDTVKRHMSLALRKLEAKDRAHAVRICFERRVFLVPDEEA